MFKTVNAYDEVVAKATDEKQTVENWDVLLTVWDKVNEDGEAGARNCVAALLKRLQHRSATVQLFSLTLAGALVQNCGSPFHKEINGKAFTSTLVRLVNDNTTHAEVKKRILKMIDEWVKEFGKDPDFDPMMDVHADLAKTHRFDDERPRTPVRGGPTAEELRREEEELQRVLAMSAADADPLRGFQKSQPASSSLNDWGYVRKALPQQPHSPLESSFVPPSSSSVIKEREEDRERMPKRVRALYDFATQTGEELDFKQGEIVNILERVDASWWRGELRGRTGIFPTNYVEELPDPPTPKPAPAQSPALTNEVDMEAQVFAQAASIDKLLQMMRTVDVRNENVAENEELLELYQQSMAIRPKVVKLIEKYNQKQADLRQISEKFAKAKATYDAMVEESTQRYTQPQSYYSGQQHHYPQQQQQQYGHQPQGSYGQPQQGQYGAPHPDQAAIEQQRIEYERQMAEYHVAMERYQAQQAAAAQQYYASQQQQQQSPAAAYPAGQQPPPATDPYAQQPGPRPSTSDPYAQPGPGPSKSPEPQQPPQQQYYPGPAAYPPGQQPPAATDPYAQPGPGPSTSAKSPDIQQPPQQQQQYYPGQDPSQPAPQPQPAPAPQEAQQYPQAAQQPPQASSQAPETSTATTTQTSAVPETQNGWQWDGYQWIWVGLPPTADPNAAGASAQAAQVVPPAGQVNPGEL